jgi:hypothetical protein
MNQFFSYIIDYLNGKSLYSPLSRGLSFLFSISISSWLFKKIYFNYSLLDITDYKAIYGFFVNGKFWIPLILFLIIHITSGFFADGFFSLFTLWKTSKWLKRIVKDKMTKKDFNSFFIRLSKDPLGIMPVKLNKSVWLIYYEQIRQSKSTEEWEKVLLWAKKKQIEISLNFKIAFKALLAVTVYFANLTYFGWRLYLISCLFILILLVFFLIAFLFLELLPVAIRKWDKEIQAHLNMPESE